MNSMTPTRLSLILLGTLACGAAWAQPQAALQARRSPVVEVFEANREAVVNISSTQVISVRPGRRGTEAWPFSVFDSFSRPRRMKATSMGSGFVIHPRGYIVTNAHVVAQTVERRVGFADGREYEARIVAIDQKNDLAILKIDSPEPLKTIRLGHSDDLMVGESVVAIGNPFGFTHTVTSGVVSAVDRHVEVQEGIVFEDLIQTDASINPGNSGGPLLNILGELIGVNSAIRGDAENIGFAIPVDHLLDQLPEMLNIERLRRLSFGLRVSGRDQAKVTEVLPDSPAQQAGVRLGDVVAGIDGLPVNRNTDVYFALLEKESGDGIRLRLLRDGKPKSVSLTIRDIPKPDGGKLARELFGLHLNELTPTECARLRLKPGTGVIVVGVDRPSPAAEIGVIPGDIIISLGRYYVSTLDEIGALLEDVRRGEELGFAGLRIERRDFWHISGILTAR